MDRGGGERRLHGFPPVVDGNCRLLILGSMPSVQSLERAQYYGYPRNHFWPMLAMILGEECPLEYSGRVEMALRHGVALWDSIATCVRPGSLDQDIRQAEPNDIPGLLRGYPHIRTVCFNGQAAQKAYDRFHARMDGVGYLLLPSSSPVPRRDIRSLEDKLPRWREALQSALQI